MERFDLPVELGLEGILRVAWISAILPLLIASIPFARIRSLRQIILTLSRRGKTTESSSRFSKITVPQRFFTHFYVVGAVWNSILLVTTSIYALKMGSLASESTFYSNVASYLTGGSHILSIHKSDPTSAAQRYMIRRSIFLLLLMEIQVLRRLYESLYVFNYSSSARMHIFAYFTGIFFYTAAPLSLCCDSAPEVFRFFANIIAEHIVYHKDQMSLETGFQWWVYLNPLLKLGWQQWIGATIFLWGSVHQWCCHVILGKLREGKEQTSHYAIPHGDWFEIVSSPHYLAEIVLYAGLLVASGGMNPTVWLLFAFVVANLAFAAAETHRWYHQKFDNYPTNRYALIPYVY